MKVTPLKQNGDFRSDECIALLKEADIVVTNPPFSLFREYINILIKNEKKFLVIGNINAVSYKEIFPLIKNNLIWNGYTNPKEFIEQVRIENNTLVPVKLKKFGNVCWYTNLDTDIRNEKMILYKTYSQEEYPKFDFYNAINIDKVKEIPKDYDGYMAVPLSFLSKYNPNQFEIVNAYECWDSSKKKKDAMLIKDKESSIDLKPKYVRVVIKRKK